jgi:fatty acid desaturase
VGWNCQRPELEVKQERLYSIPFSRKHFSVVFLLDLVGFGIREFVKLLRVLRPKQLKPILGLLAFWGLAVAVLMTVGWQDVLVIYFISILTSFWAVFRIRTWSEHIGIQGTHRFDPGVFARYFLFPHNTWCHYEHHKWPTISYQHLPAARECDTSVEILSSKQLFDFFSGKSSERR